MNLITAHRLWRPPLSWAAGALFAGGLLQWLALPVGPPAWRSGVLAAWSVGSLIVALRLVWDWRWLRIPLLVFAVTLVLGWSRALESHTAFTHFAGACLGLLWMAVVARYAVTPSRLTVAMLVFLGPAAVALAVGIAGVPAFFPPEVYSILPGDLPFLRRALASAERREVNQNALAALVLLVLPIAASALLMRVPSRVLQLLLHASGAIVVVGGVWILIVTRSRTALIAVWLLLLIALVRGPRSLPWRLSAGVLTGLLPLAAVAWMYVTPREFALEAVARLHYSLHDRVQILGYAAQQFADNPWLGIGFNEFRHSYVAPPGSQATVAHAHNIFVQTGLDLGLVGLIGYCWLLGIVLVRADWASRGPSALPRYAAAGGAFSLIAVHLFGLADAVALGAKIGLFQWMAAGLILGSWSLQRTAAARFAGPPPVVEPGFVTVYPQ